MATEIKSKSELDALASKLATLTSSLKSEGSTLKGKLSGLENYDGIDVASAGQRLSQNINNVLIDLDTVSTNIKKYSASVMGFDVDDFGSSVSSTSSESKIPYSDLFVTDGSAEGNAKVIWNFLKYKGLSDAAAAGVLGNIQAESGFDPAIVERATGVGYGLIQWSFGRRTALEQAASAQGVAPSNLQFQLEYLWDESLDPNTSYGKKLAAAGFYDTNSASDAAYYFHKYVEISNDSYSAIQNNRCRTAEQWYSKFKGTDAGEVGAIISTGKSSGWANLAGTITATQLSYTPSHSGSSSSGASNATYYVANSVSSSSGFPHSTANRNVKMANIDYEKLEAYLEELKGTGVKLPDGLGSVHAYMGWQCITSRSSDQYKLIESAGMNFDSEGFAKIGDRYVVATTTTFGNVGDFIDVVQDDGTIIKCVIGDIKNQNDAGCNMWGHNNGQCVVEFVVDKSSWYGTNKTVNGFHPEWNQNVDTIINKGNYFDLAQKYPKTAVI